VFLNEQGSLLTDLHVVWPCQRLLISDGTVTNEATILTFDIALDVAVLETPFRRAETAVFAVLPVLSLGDGVTVVGYVPQTNSRTIVAAAGSISVLTDAVGSDDFFQTSAIVMHGQSGGPVIEKRGLMIGLVKSEPPSWNAERSPETRSVVTSGARIAAFLERSKIAFRRMAPTGSVSPPIPSFAAGAGLGYVECWALFGAR
jgi:hypothetical protein